MVEEVKKTDSGIPIKKVFSGQDLKKYKSNKEKPGRYPYTQRTVSLYVQRKIMDNETVQWIW